MPRKTGSKAFLEHPAPCLEKSNKSGVSANLDQMNEGIKDSTVRIHLIKPEISFPSIDLQSIRKVNPKFLASSLWVEALSHRQPYLFPTATLLFHALSACPSELKADVLISGAKLLDSSSLWTLHTKCKHFLPFGQTLAQKTFFPMLTAGSLNKSSVSRRVGEEKKLILKICHQQHAIARENGTCFPQAQFTQMNLTASGITWKKENLLHEPCQILKRSRLSR